MAEAQFDLAALDDRADSSGALRTAIEAAHREGGGTVRLLAGVHTTGPLRLLSNVTLMLEPGSVLRFDPTFDRYPPVRTRWEGVECYAAQPLLFAENQGNVAIVGAGTIDGQGLPWWNAYRESRLRGRLTPESDFEKRIAALNRGYANDSSGGGGRELQFLRPPLIQLTGCRNVRLEGITLRDSPFWCAHILYCDTVRVADVTFRSPSDAPNTDGLDIDSSSNVMVSGCDFDVGDDCICLKSGAGEDGMRVGRPTSSVIISNCLMRAGHGGVVVGSETAGGIRDVSVTSCVMAGTDRGIRVKTRRGRGGVIENLSFADLIIRDSLCPLVINCYYGCGTESGGDGDLFSLLPQPIAAGTPLLRNITVSNLLATGCRAAAGFIVGLPERPIESLVLTDCRVFCELDSRLGADHAAMSAGLPHIDNHGIRVREVLRGSFRNVEVTGAGSDPILREVRADVKVL